MTEITLEQANKIIEAAHQEGQQRKLSPLTVVVFRLRRSSKSTFKSRWRKFNAATNCDGKSMGQLASVYHLANWQRWAKQGLCS